FLPPVRGGRSTERSAKSAEQGSATSLLPPPRAGEGWGGGMPEPRTIPATTASTAASWRPVVAPSPRLRRAPHPDLPPRAGEGWGGGHAGASNHTGNDGIGHGILASSRRALTAPSARPHPGLPPHAGEGAKRCASLLFSLPRAGEGAQSAVQRARSKEARLPFSLPRVRGGLGRGHAGASNHDRQRRRRPRHSSTSSRRVLAP